MIPVGKGSRSVRTDIGYLQIDAEADVRDMKGLMPGFPEKSIWRKSPKNFRGFIKHIRRRFGMCLIGNSRAFGDRIYKRGIKLRIESML